MDASSLKIIKARAITPQGILDNATVVVKDGKIASVGVDDLYETATIIDAVGKYLSPGFIDIHVHGGGGHDFMDNTIEAYLEIAKLHASYGTTAFTPTTLSCEHEELLKTLALYEEAEPLNADGARFIGMHIEGPYFSMEQRGAQDPRFIRKADAAEYTDVLNKSKIITRWSAAPEVEGAIELGCYLTERGILPSIAHTNAVYDDVVTAYEVGYTHMTHFYSCMSGVTRKNAFRYAGVVESGYLLDGMTVEIIADGRHLPPSLLKLVYKIKGADKIALVTDAMRAAGMPPGESVLGRLTDGLKVIVEDDVAKLPDRSAFAGSVATTIQLVKNMVTLAEVPLTDAIKMMTATPAKIAGVADKMGTLEVGKYADMVLFDDDINLHTTIIGGKVVHTV
ncbi:N-acetylglucosamine-6-phosphate deacetylase [Mucilaginibacter pedocola]|uniref:N-acetylglucosamine-6-phosphate deacetylase n=1 Tax=Mucilaginibacter pedocola TaxID=1792845 RepID=A0A1S9PFR0_9SPHI|nr:N-acetylglucosamine-6-phosphate deacetylase [Mucilaginibacter pedocola]OOQ59786.1 N-acetylglucosamine-6-phosphate deacetylase [Mucilaginibacter pedocola]